MKRLFFMLCLLSATLILKAAPTAYFSYTVFNVPGKGPYVETYLTVIGNSVTFLKSKEGLYHGTVTIGIIAKSGDSVVTERKYNLLSQGVSDSINLPNFTDIQRFALENGDYTFEIKVADPSAPETSFSSIEKIHVEIAADKPAFSSIEFIEAYSKSTSQGILTKSGIDMIPYNSDFFPENMEKLIFYSELYNVGNVIPAGEKFLVEAYVRDFESKKRFVQFGRFFKETSQDVTVSFSEIDIKDLTSGNYEFVVDMRDKENKLIASKVRFFQRRNNHAQLSLESIESISTENTFVSNIHAKDTLIEFIRCLRPISEKNEITYAENILKGGDKEMMKKYIYSFWQKRSALSPQSEWERYYEQVRAVNKSFGTQIEKGYLTDRGRVYLQYGTPDSRNIYVHESSSYPYEIWQYNKVKKQTNRKFVFYDPELMNNFRLLHSDALGEPYEPRWQIRLRSRDHVNPNIDQETAPGIYGNNPEDNYRNPR